MRAVELVILGLVGVVILTQALIDLEVALDLGAWHANAPVVDLAALALLPLAAWGWLRRRTPLPGPRGYALFLLASVLSLLAALHPAESLHHLVRKPLFLYLAYGLGLAWAVARAVPRAHSRMLLLVWAGGTGALSLGTSLARIAAGNTLWFSTIEGITPNHKTLAVALAGALPLVVGAASELRGREARPAGLALGLALGAIALSASKSAWITTALALGLWWPRGPARRPLSLRPRLVLPVLVLGFALAYYAPVLVGSKTMLDAARSRHSLNVRAWQLFEAHPFVGAGSGVSTQVEMVTFPHYRINGVDAHGVIQKVGAETGLLGLAGFGWFALATGAGLRRRWDGRRVGLSYGAAGTWLTLHLNLLLSTETFSPTHWVPLALAWGLSQRPPDPPDPAGPHRPPGETAAEGAPCAS